MNNSFTIINKYFLNKHRDDNNTCSNMAEWCWMEMWNNQLNLASYITRLKYSANLEDSYTTIKKELLYENEDEFRTLYQSISSIQSYNNSEGTMMELNFLEKNENIMKKIINETFNEMHLPNLLIKSILIQNLLNNFDF